MFMLYLSYKDSMYLTGQDVPIARPETIPREEEYDGLLLLLLHLLYVSKVAKSPRRRSKVSIFQILLNASAQKQGHYKKSVKRNNSQTTRYFSNNFARIKTRVPPRLDNVVVDFKALWFGKGALNIQNQICEPTSAATCAALPCEVLRDLHLCTSVSALRLSQLGNYISITLTTKGW